MNAFSQDIGPQRSRLDAALWQFQAAEAERAKTFNEGEVKRIEQATATEEQRRGQAAAAADERKAAFSTFIGDGKKRIIELGLNAHGEEAGRQATFTRRLEEMAQTFRTLVEAKTKTAERCHRRNSADLAAT